MCGIAGWLGTLEDGASYARRMARALHHRGPDAQGIRSWPGATFVHTRLSIIDLSPAAAQPLTNTAGTVWTVFNGEIYNHRQLRHELEAKGHSFTSRSDAEVLPHLYEEEGRDFVAKLKGMFALAMYDTRARTLLLARDRFGIKPLFYAVGKDRIAFASELRALRELPGIDSRPDRQAVHDFTGLGFIPAPETFYVGIRALQPSETLEARSDGDGVSWATRAYHRWVIAPAPAMTLSQAADRAEELLAGAVQRQLESDVSLGSLLSGGIDSSLVSAAAQRTLHGGALNTFNVRFSAESYDETWAAELVARHIGSRHTSMNMDDARGSWDHVTDLLRHAGQPFADTSLFAVNAICRLMRQHVTVALSGDGGDEGFGGYDIYWRLARIARVQSLPTLFLTGAGRALGGLSSLGLASDRASRRIQELAGADDTSVIQTLFSFMAEHEHRDLSEDATLLPVRRFFEPQWEYHLPARASRIERLSAHATEVNTRLSLPNDFLFKVDIASMKESLEVRVPMLDEDLFTFGLSLPHSLKVRGRSCKRTLRAVAARQLPAAVANKPKWGFAVPLESWVGPDFTPNLRDVLLGASGRLGEFFRPEAYRSILEAVHDDRSSSTRDYRRAMMLLGVHLALSGTD
jgi:asparagine synthase (glutamine-hydrolysing)